MLCEFASLFPQIIARLLERDRFLTRNFREETVTDLLMVGLMPFRPLGVRVDFPDETVTGGDMEWIYAAPREVSGGAYLRLIIQSKRCKESTGRSPYWYYEHLDHGRPRGSQSRTLMRHASASPATLPLYMFYHPQSALAKSVGGVPAIEGINIRLARDVYDTVKNGCNIDQKKVSYWRKKFMSLPDLLCWPTLDGGRSIAFHPDIVAERINYLCGDPSFQADVQAVPSLTLPEAIRNAIEGDMTDTDRAGLKRPRIIFSTSLTSDDPDFEQLRAAVRNIGGRGIGD